MKKVTLFISLLLFCSSYLFSQNYGGVRHLRTQGVVGFQNGLGIDVEYVIPVMNERLAIRTGFGLLPFNAGSLEIDNLKGDLEMSASTFDFGLKYYFSGRSHGMFLGVDVGFNNLSLLFDNINGTTNSLYFMEQEFEEEVTVTDGVIDEKISSMMITPKFGWTKVGNNGFTWSFEVGYTLINVDEHTATLVNNQDGVPVPFQYKFENVFEELFGMSGLPYVRIGFGYAFKLTKNTY